MIDVARYIRASHRQLTDFSDAVYSPKWLQEELTVFFDRWDRGRLHKVKTPDGWRIETKDNLHAPLAPVAAQDAAPAQAPRVLRLKIDPKTMGLKVL